MLIDLYLQGRLPLDTFVTEEIGIDDVDEAFLRMKTGDVLRSVVVLDDTSPVEISGRTNSPASDEVGA